MNECGLIGFHASVYVHSPTPTPSAVVCPCVNGGVCSPENFTAYNETMCVCPEVYTGDLCEASKLQLQMFTE